MTEQEQESEKSPTSTSLWANGSVTQKAAAEAKAAVAKPPIVIEPIQYADPHHTWVKYTFAQTVSQRLERYVSRRGAEYSGFRSICARWMANIHDEDGNDILSCVVLIASSVVSIVTAGSMGARDPAPLWLTVVSALPLLCYFAARWLTRDRKTKVWQPWLRPFIERRAKKFNGIKNDIEAFNAWAQSAEIPEDLAEDIVAHAEARRQEIIGRAQAYLADVDRVIKHREKLARFKEAHRRVDAAFPDPTGRMTRDIGPRMAVLRSGDALLEEAVELGLSTDEIIAVRGSPS